VEGRTSAIQIHELPSASRLRGRAGGRPDSWRARGLRHTRDVDLAGVRGSEGGASGVLSEVFAELLMIINDHDPLYSIASRM
jgi:hypothetical protein